MTKKLFLISAFLVVALMGCCHTEDRVKQTLDNVHHTAMDGEQGQIPKGEEDVTR